MVTVNGKQLDIAGKNFGEYLSECGYDRNRIATELNGNILTKSEYDNTILKDNDKVEIVSFVGGG